ncbi:uncharacterized protein UTRI_06536_B [Ustilago trichophora]|uniref:Uncharacterized protein n=1 Tax=Ustilago trichophora TaxID=86804 RepID=A0A5C3EPT9_9BASI|nr:uncharacterized protein UTRI_06536_B [Ustilago trichophora]
MVKKEYAKVDPHHNDSDTFDELEDDADMKSPKKAKKETKFDACESPDTKLKRSRASTSKAAWSKEEEEDLMDCLQNIIAANMAQAVKDFPRTAEHFSPGSRLAARKSGGCIKHWNGIRRRHETAILGAPTISHNGKKIAIADRVKDDLAKTK